MLNIIKEEEIDFELTVLALREAIMNYFKDYIGNRYITNDYIQLHRVSQIGGRLSDRREHELQARTHINIGKEIFATMQKVPDKLEFHTVKSDELQKLRDAILPTIQLYLPNVEVRYE